MRRRMLWVAVAATAVATVMTTADAGQPPLKFRVVDLPRAKGATEPSVVVDSKGRIFVSAIFGVPELGHLGTPVWRSTDGGRTFTMHSTAHAGPLGTPLGGGDSALVLDKRDYLYATDLWLGDDSVAVSTDHAATWTGSPVSHRMVGDRNWLAYARHDDSIYQVWNGIDALWVARADVGGPAGHLAAMSFTNQYVVAGETVGVPGSYVRAQTAWPGGLAVDPREDAVYATWSDQFGVAVGRSDTRGEKWRITHIPGTKLSGDFHDTAWNYTPVVVDSKGTVFVMWSQANESTKEPEGITTYLAASRDNGKTWRKMKVPTRKTSVFPTLGLLGNDRVALSWIDSTATGNPNSKAAFAGEPWRLAYAEVTGLGANRPSVVGATVEKVVHEGTVYVGTQGGDRGMGDFFSMTVAKSGQVVIAYSKTSDENINSTDGQPRVATLSPRR